MSEYTYRGDKLTSPHLKDQPCAAVRRPDGKCIRSPTMGTMLVDFVTQGRHVVLARQLRKLKCEPKS